MIGLDDSKDEPFLSVLEANSKLSRRYLKDLPPQRISYGQPDPEEVVVIIEGNRDCQLAITGPLYLAGQDRRLCEAPMLAALLIPPQEHQARQWLRIILIPALPIEPDLRRAGEERNAHINALPGLGGVDHPRRSGFCQALALLPGKIIPGSDIGPDQGSSNTPPCNKPINVLVGEYADGLGFDGVLAKEITDCLQRCEVTLKQTNLVELIQS